MRNIARIKIIDCNKMIETDCMRFSIDMRIKEYLQMKISSMDNIGHGKLENARNFNREKGIC